MNNRMHLEVQADRIEMTLSGHKVRSRVAGGTVTPRFIRFDLTLGDERIARPVDQKDRAWCDVADRG